MICLLKRYFFETNVLWCKSNLKGFISIRVCGDNGCSFRLSNEQMMQSSLIAIIYVILLDVLKIFNIYEIICMKFNIKKSDEKKGAMQIAEEMQLTELCELSKKSGIRWVKCKGANARQVRFVKIWWLAGEENNLEVLLNCMYRNYLQRF